MIYPNAREERFVSPGMLCNIPSSERAVLPDSI